MADVTITPTNVVPPNVSTTVHGSLRSLIAGEAIAAGETYCIAVDDSKAYKADANNALRMPMVGFNGVSSVAAGQRVDGITESPALVIGTHGVTVGTPLYQSNTPGKICPFADLSTGSRPQLVAIPVTTTSIQVISGAGGITAIP